MSKERIEALLWETIDLMASTLEKPDPRIWDHLLVYKPKAVAETDANESGKCQPVGIPVTTTPAFDALHQFDADNNVEPFRATATRIAQAYMEYSELVDAISHALEDAAEIGKKRGPLEDAAIADAETRRTAPHDASLLNCVSSDPLSNPIPNPVGETVMGDTHWCGHSVMASLCPICNPKSPDPFTRPRAPKDGTSILVTDSRVIGWFEFVCWDDEKQMWRRTMC